MLVLGMAGAAVAQDNGAQQPSARQQLQHIHTPQSIDQELARLTKDLELTPQQQQQVRPLLDEHHDRIQALLDKDPTVSRQKLDPQNPGYQQRNAPQDSCSTYRPPERIGKGDAATRA
jgi:Spy/CpxP family protein refolding chaperone